ncbi:UDP-N-acetyl-D-mannosamine dehydrogenase [Verrucomicrobia bacterium]|nr:UDP-N-acetyl-D-mannosamine dehydrogenase [Verrucomicrobiota bacterium]
MKDPEVVMMGLGYIGLPTAALIANGGVRVLGVDINSHVVETVNAGKVHIVEPELDKAVSRGVESGMLRANAEPASADVYLVVVPTPFKDRNEPDTSYVEAASRSLLKLLKPGDLFIIESTSPVGTTESMAEIIFSERPDLRGNLHMAYCPERVLPGNVMHELVHNDRVIGGLDEAATKKAVDFYGRFVEGELHATNARTAELCKLVENSSRDVQIAFANELSFICDKANIDVWELIRLANKHPRVNILQPGSGVGGHCIAVDPYFIVSEYPMESKIIGTAREINNYKSFWCAEKIKNKALQFELQHGRKPKVALMGLAFKPNIDDLRESPATYIVQKVIQASGGEDYFITEPNIERHSVFKMTNYQDAFNQADVVAFLVAHREFKELSLTPEKVILDFAGVFAG